MAKPRTYFSLEEIVGILLVSILLMVLAYNLNKIYWMTKPSDACKAKDAVLFCKDKLESKSWSF